jgi:GDPmannose 4,6-dehydratase
VTSAAPTALIVGSGGQDGRLLGERLLSLGYEISGLDRGSIDITDPEAVTRCVSETEPREVYFLAAYHHSSEDSHEDDGELFRNSIDVHDVAAVNFLDAIARRSPATRFFYAASCLIFPPTEGAIQTEDTIPCPDSAYAITKHAGMLMTRHYREKRGIFASVGILYNHESPLRSPRFVTRKIASAAARIATEGSGELVLGDIEARVDWGYARDYVNAIHLVLQTDHPGDYVIASGAAHTVGEFADIAFRHVGLDYRDHLSLRPQTLSRKNLTRIGDSSRLRSQTGWRPTVSFEELVCLMVDAELKRCGAKDALNE